MISRRFAPVLAMLSLTVAGCGSSPGELSIVPTGAKPVIASSGEPSSIDRALQSARPRLSNPLNAEQRTSQSASRRSRGLRGLR